MTEVTRSLTKGINEIAKAVADNHTKQSHLEGQLRTAQTQVESLLVSGYMTIDITRQLCTKLFELPTADRQEYIRSNWGPLFLEKVQHPLHQVSVIERELAALRDKKPQ